MSWRNRFITSVPHPLMPTLTVVGFVVSHGKEEIKPAEEIISEIMGDPVIHPDTVRLNHLLKMDHSVLAPPGLDNVPAIESIHFIYDGYPGATKEDSLRAAIDNSIAVHEMLTMNETKEAA